MTIHQRISLFLGWSYRCRCGAIIPSDYRKLHEEHHIIMREFLNPPTIEEMKSVKNNG